MSHGSHGKSKDVERLQDISRYCTYCTKQTKGQTLKLFMAEIALYLGSQLLACSSRRAFLGDCADDDWQTCKLLWHPRKMSEGNLPQQKHPVESHTHTHSHSASCHLVCGILNISQHFVWCCLSHVTQFDAKHGILPDPPDKVRSWTAIFALE